MFLHASSYLMSSVFLLIGVTNIRVEGGVVLEEDEEKRQLAYEPFLQRNAVESSN